MNKRIFAVAFEAPGTANVNLVGNELSDSFLAGYTSKCKEEGTFPKGVVGIKTVYITDDDSAERNDKETKVFTCITLLVEAADESEAEKMTPPENLLTHLADECATVENDENSLVLDSFEVTDVEEHVGGDSEHEDAGLVKKECTCNKSSCWNCNPELYEHHYR